MSAPLLLDQYLQLQHLHTTATTATTTTTTTTTATATTTTARETAFDPWPRCPVKGHLVFRRVDSSQRAYGRCGQLRCHACLAPAALDHSAAISAARPSYLVTLTRVGLVWTAVRAGIQEFVRALRSRSRATIECAYHVESNPKGTGNHVHMWVRTSEMDPVEVALAAGRARLGREFDVTALRQPGDGSRMPGTAYGMKTCLERPAEATSLWPAAEQFLALNGGRLEHHSRGFFIDRDGQAVGVRVAIREARAAYGLSGGWGPSDSFAL